MITLAQSKVYLGVEHTDDDILITDLLAQIQGAVEDYTGLLLSSQTLTEVYDGSLALNLVLDYHPVESITSVSDLSSGTPVALGATEYDFDVSGLLFLTSGGAWGVGRKRWQVVYVAGYGDEEGNPITPKAILLAVQTWLADVYASRHSMPTESVGSVTLGRGDHQIPTRVKALLGKYWRLSF